MAKAGQNQGAVTMKGQRTERELAALLGEIGTKRRSIAPVILEEETYAKRLRACSYIAVRVPPSASNGTVAVVANSAIRTAVKNLPSPTDRLVAEAALGVGEFEGFLLKERRRDVAATADIGCDENSFRRRRERLLPFIARYLLKEDAPVRRGSSRNVTSASATPTEAKATRYLGDLADEAVNLHYHCLGLMFLTQYHYLPRHLPPENNYRRYRRHDFVHLIWEELAMVLLTRAVIPYHDALSALQYHLTNHGFAETEAVLTREDHHQVRDLIELVRTMLPFDSDPMRLLVLNKEGYISEDEANLPEIFSNTWKPWFYRALFEPNDRWWRGIGLPSEIVTDSLTPPPIEVLAARSGALGRAITRHLSIPRPIVSDARRRVRKLMSYVFEPDEFEPLYDGRSLRDLLDSFLDEQGVLLADSSIVWYKNV